MSCDELERMRSEARHLKSRIDEQRRKANTKAREERSRPSGKSEMVPFLQRKLLRVSVKIEQHVAQHHCQD